MHFDESLARKQPLIGIFPRSGNRIFAVGNIKWTDYGTFEQIFQQCQKAGGLFRQNNGEWNERRRSRCDGELGIGSGDDWPRQPACSPRRIISGNDTNFPGSDNSRLRKKRYESIFSPTMEMMSVVMKNSRQKVAGSWKTKMPNRTVPTAPMPVHTG